MSQYLSEAFKKLSVLNEDTFSLDDEGIKGLEEFEDNTDEEIIDVIDTEATSEEDLADSYVGKVILDCTVCHSKLYKDASDVVVEGEFANAGEECPFCYTPDGFKVIGQVAEYAEDTTDDVDDDTAPANEEQKSDADDSVDENLSEGIFGLGKKKKPNYFSKEEIAKRRGAREDAFNKKQAEMDREERERGAEIAKGWKEREDRQRQSEQEHNRSRHNSIKGSNVSNTGKAGVHYSGGDYYSESLQEDNNNVNEPTNANNHFKVGDEFEYIGEYEGVYFKGKVTAIENGVMRANLTYELTNGEKVTTTREYRLTTDAKGNECFVAKNYRGQTGFIYPPARGYSAFSESKSIKESVNNVNVETDEDVINVSTDDSGKVTVTTEPKSASVGGEVIAPIDPELQSDISNNVADGEEIELDVAEFDEQSFDDLGEGYLRKIYENVNSYKTTKASIKGGKLMLEGVIKFKSGKSKKTNFIFESSTVTKSGKMKFIGENAQITKGKKAFTVTGKLEGKKFLSESFNYNYRAKDSKGKSMRLYGTVKNESFKKGLKEAPMYDMSPNFDARKSFYGKARVDDNGDTKTLLSYNTPVCKIDGGKVTLLPRWDESQTTLRHVKEFLKQNGFTADSLAQIRRDYA